MKIGQLAWDKLANDFAARLAVLWLRYEQSDEVAAVNSRPGRLSGRQLIIDVDYAGKPATRPLFVVADEDFYAQYGNDLYVDLNNNEGTPSQKWNEIPVPFVAALIEQANEEEEGRYIKYHPIPIVFTLDDPNNRRRATTTLYAYVPPERFDEWQIVARAMMNQWHHEVGQADPNATLPVEDDEDQILHDAIMHDFLHAQEAFNAADEDAWPDDDYSYPEEDDDIPPSNEDERTFL